MTEGEQRFARGAVRRRRLFLGLAGLGVVVAASLAVYFAWQRSRNDAYPVGTRAALVVLILLNARQNLRQYRYAGVIEKLERQGAPGSNTGTTG